MHRRVIILGTLGPWTEEKREGDELWGCNACAWRHDNLTTHHIDRLYMADSPEVFHGMDTSPILQEAGMDYVEAINAAGCDVYSCGPHPGINRLHPYPLAAVVGSTGITTFCSTIAYMVAHAITEGVDEIVIHRVFCLPHSVEYLNQVPNINLWVGYAMGRGIKVSISEDSHIARSFPWEPDAYGYVGAPLAGEVNKTIAGAISQCHNRAVLFTENYNGATSEALAITQGGSRIERYHVEPFEEPDEHGNPLRCHFPEPQWVRPAQAKKAITVWIPIGGDEQKQRDAMTEQGVELLEG